MVVRKLFSIPEDLWDEFVEYRKNHPEINLSGIIQKTIKEMVEGVKNE
ncbi:MAG: hypothetical protein ACTSVK_17995 [Promethearchaeota archaeon]